jgi:hypothetical protein
MIRKSLNGLIEMIRQFPPPHVTPFKEYGRKENVSPEIQEEDHESKILTEQLESVNQLIKDLSKINKQLLH